MSDADQRQGTCPKQPLEFPACEYVVAGEMTIETASREKSLPVTACPLCLSTMRPIFTTADYRRPRDKNVYTVCWCDGCAYGRVAACLEPDQVSDFYEVDYYTHLKSSANESTARFFDKLRSYLAWRVDNTKELTAAEGYGRFMLDVGCGGGHNMRKFAEDGYSVTGVEPDASAREAAARFGPVFAGTAENVPRDLTAQRFDTVVLSHVLEHCIDPTAALRSLRPLVAAGGRLIVEVPNNAARAFKMFKSLWPWTDVPRHLHFFTEQSLLSILERSGLRATKVIYLGYSRQFQASWIASQEEIWKSIGDSSTRPSFRRSAWLLLALTAFARASSKYDSIRVHAEPVEASKSNP